MNGVGVGRRGIAVARRWVVIETGSNQQLVFQTNKQRLNVAASRLIWRVGFEWIPEAIEQVGGKLEVEIRNVVRASGLGTMITTPEAGRAIIEVVTTRAALEAPDLDIWGVVGETDLAEDLSNAGPTLGQAQRQLARWRADRPSPITRDPNLPYTQFCAFTGRPASGDVSEGTHTSRVHYPAAPGVAALWDRSMNDRDSLVAKLGGGEVVERAVVGRKELESGDGVANNGWVGVLHADGNGIGDIFTNLRRVYDDTELIERLETISRTLEDCAWRAVTNAVSTIQQKADEDAGENGTRPKNWILPILVGGDDITVLLDGRHAFEFTCALAAEFERLINEPAPDGSDNPVIESLQWVAANQDEWVDDGFLTSATAPERITLACGLVYVKPHHPFSHAVAFAEELTTSAKTVKGDGLSALDVHVLNESAVRELAKVREPLAFGGRKLWAGPIVLGGDQHVRDNDKRHLNHLQEAMDLIRPVASDEPGEEIPLVPSGVLHALREALTTGGEANLDAVARRAKEVAAGYPYADSLTALLDQHLEPDGVDFSRLLTAMELLDVSTGTVAGGRDA